MVESAAILDCKYPERILLTPIGALSRHARFHRKRILCKHMTPAARERSSAMDPCPVAIASDHDSHAQGCARLPGTNPLGGFSNMEPPIARLTGQDHGTDR